MKILQIIQRPQRRGAEIFACQLSQHLQEKGHQVDVLFLFGNPGEILDFPLRFSHLQAAETKRWWDFGAYKRLAQMIKRNGYDLVQANAGDTLKYAALSKRLHGWGKAKLVFRNANKISDFVKAGAKKFINQQLVGQVDVVASVSENCRQDFVATFHFPEAKTASLPIGTSLHLPAAYSSWEEANLPFENHHQVCVQIGGLVPEKNHQWTIGQMQAWAQLHPTLRLLFCGDGRLKEALQAQAKEAGLEHKIYFAGNRPDVLKLMPLCKALLMPSKIEGLPGVILEAMAAGLPVIANKVGGVGEVVHHQQTGYLINPDDAMAFADALNEVLTQPQASIVQQAKDQIRDHYTIEKVCNDFEAKYTKWLTD